MKSKEQEKSDFWEAIIVLGGGLIIGGVCGFIAMISGSEPTSVIGMLCLIFWIFIIFVAIWEWIKGKKEKRRIKRARKNYKPPKSSSTMISSSGMRWKKCPQCGHKLNNVAKKCPYCSFQFNNNTKHSLNKNKEKARKKSNKKGQSTYDMIKNEFGTKKCPRCNKEVIATSVRCKYCKYQFKKSHNKKEVAIKVNKKELSAYDRLKNKYSTKKCPNCNKEVIATAKICKYCKYSFNENSSKKMYEYKKCPFCEKIILKSDRKCKHCKRAL